MLYTLSIESSPIDVETAKVNAGHFLSSSYRSKAYASKGHGIGGEAEKLSLVYSSSSRNKAGYSMYHVFNRGNNEGFVIVAGDDCINDVLCFSDVGSFDLDSLPENVKWWMDEYERNMLNAIENHINIAIDLPKGDMVSNIHPLLKSNWGQGTPYNDKCPLSSSGKRCVTGCIATALAQIMYYHQWPDYGNGYHEYECNINSDANNKVVLSADFSGTKYQWDKMRSTYSSTSDDVEANEAVATLMYQIGVSLDMVYGENGSSPTYIKEAGALTRYFRYKTDIVSEPQVENENLSTILYDELLNKRPVFVCGRGINNGYHAFVCDGYQSGGYFHFNWGWGGKYNAYCLLSKMIPLSGYDYSYNHRVVYRIEPDKLTLNVNEPGTLQELVDLNHADESTTLVVTGKLNGNDILTLRKLAGRDMYNNKTNGMRRNRQTLWGCVSR